MQHLHDFRINIRRRHIRTGKRGASVKILALYGRKAHQAEFFAHTESCYHVAGKICRLLNIIRRSRRHRIKHDFFRRTASEQPYQSVAQLSLGIQILLFLRDVHDITERPHRPRHDRDLLYRFRIFLQSADERMSDLMIGNDLTFFFAHDPVFLFFSYQHLLYRIEQILLADKFSSHFYRIDSGLVNHIGKIRTDSTGCRERDFIQVDRFIHENILRMDFQNFNPAF